MSSMGDAALRCLLVLIHRSFRFDPDTSEWTCPEKQFSRREIEAATGLSDQGTRDGLAELEEIGYAKIDCSGRSYSYALRMGVPSRRFTYVPTTLLEKASELPSGAALRVVLAVLRATWGWTSKRGGSGGTVPQTVHKRWAELSNGNLAGATGRSEPAVRQAAKALEGTWISRVRPGNGAHLYRILPSVLLPDDEGEERSTGQDEDASPKTPTANEVSPYRQRSFPPSSSKESFSKDKQTGKLEPKPESSPEQSRQETGESGLAVPDSQNQTAEDSPPNFSDLPDRKQSLAEKLTNAGIWPGRARECLRRYSTARIEENFRLWRARKNDSEAPEIKNDGAWLCMAITEGYANVSAERISSKQGSSQGSDPNAAPSSPDRPSANTPSKDSSRPPEPSHKQRVSPREKTVLLRHYEEITSDQFHRFRHGENPAEKQFLYLDPSVGGPKKRSRNRRPRTREHI